MANMCGWGVSAALQASGRGAERVPDHPAVQDRGLWGALQELLLAGHRLLQVQPGRGPAGPAVGQVLGEPGWRHVCLGAGCRCFGEEGV